MKKALSIILILILILSLVGCQRNESSFGSDINAEEVPKEEISETNVAALDMLTKKLTDEGYTISQITKTTTDDQPYIHKILESYIIELEGEESVYIHVFEDAKKAKEHADCYNDDGSEYNAPNISMVIDYIAPVRMWQYEECVIEYAYDKNTLYLPICQVFGAPFVGKTDVLEIIEATDIQYIRTNQQSGDIINNRTVMIKSAEELAKYYEDNKEIFDLERKETVYSDTTIGFLDACDLYTDEWFEANDLILVVLSEGSGSIHHKITSVTIRNYDLETFIEEDFAIQINVQRIFPEVGTCDMAEWHIMIGLPKREYPEIIGLGVNETWDTDFSDMMEETENETDGQSLSYFPQGLLAVQVDGLFGYIDKSGKFAIKPQFDSALQFASNGLACVCINDKFGYINTKGDIVIEPQYDLGYSFEECGLAAVCVDKKFGFIDSSGNYVFEPTFSWVSGAFYDAEGTFGKHGIACVRIGDYPDSKFAFVDINGNYVTEPIFDYASSFADNGLAAVMIVDNYNQNRGYINTSGEYVIQPKEYSYVGDFASNGLANVLTVSGKYGYIDETGKYAIEPKFTYAGDFGENGLAVVQERITTNRGVVGSYYGIIDSKGKYVIKPNTSEPKIEFMSNFFDNGLAVAKIGAKSGYVNMEGKFVIEPIYIRTGNFVNGLASVNEGRGDGYINEKGEYVIEPREDIYYAYPFDDDGYAVIRGDENWTVINRNGETVFGPFDWINCDSKLWFGQNYESMFEPV